MHGAIAGVITTICAIGNNGVGNVEGGVEVIDAAAFVGCSIAREGGIGDGEGAAVKDATTIGCRIAIEGGIGNGEGAADSVFDAATHGCRIASDCGIGDCEGAGISKCAAIKAGGICPGNSYV